MWQIVWYNDAVTQTTLRYSVFSPSFTPPKELPNTFHPTVYLDRTSKISSALNQQTILKITHHSMIMAMTTVHDTKSLGIILHLPNNHIQNPPPTLLLQPSYSTTADSHTTVTHTVVLLLQSRSNVSHGQRWLRSVEVQLERGMLQRV